MCEVSKKQKTHFHGPQLVNLFLVMCILCRSKFLILVKSPTLDVEFSAHINLISEYRPGIMTSRRVTGSSTSGHMENSETSETVPSFPSFPMIPSFPCARRMENTEQKNSEISKIYFLKNTIYKYK